ncbi:MarR family transcriptional regulator [Arthrobacter sp. TB 23]|uniref:MarR family transcriptional regulator n=1 Tax=Arthrobacter sp. TB 23 TaxID=494419 RepID=UPI00031D6430|nr:MarR family transcriptional regulator [Arthrobacter sp. TB 23]
MSISPLKTGEKDLATTLAFAARRVSAQIERVVSVEGLTVDQWSVLDFAARSGSPVTMSEIIRAVGLSGPSLTRATDKLVTASLIFREIHPDDRRRVLIQPSTRGLELHGRTQPKVEAAQSEIIANVRDPQLLLQTLGGLAR